MLIGGHLCLSVGLKAFQVRQLTAVAQIVNIGITAVYFHQLDCSASA